MFLKFSLHLSSINTEEISIPVNTEVHLVNLQWKICSQYSQCTTDHLLAYLPNMCGLSWNGF